MKHKRTLISIAMAAIVLLAGVAVCASVSAAPGSSSNVQSVVGATVVGAPAVCSVNGISADLFVRGANGSIYWKHSSDGTTWPSTSTCLGGYATSDPAAVTTSNSLGSYVNVFVRGGDGALWGKYTDNGGNTWSGWFSLGGQLLPGTGPAACNFTVNGGGNTGIFVIGTDHALWWLNWGVSGWASLGGYLTSSPAAAASNGAIDVVARGGDGALWEKDTSNGGAFWGNWYSRGGQLLPGTGPAVVWYWETAYVIGTDHALWWQSPASWASLGGYLTSSPAAVPTSSSTQRVFARGGDNFLWERVTTNGGNSWGDWFSIGGI